MLLHGLCFVKSQSIYRWAWKGNPVRQSGISKSASLDPVMIQSELFKMRQWHLLKLFPVCFFFDELLQDFLVNLKTIVHPNPYVANNRTSYLLGPFAWKAWRNSECLTERSTHSFRVKSKVRYIYFHYNSMRYQCSLKASPAKTTP